MRQIENPVGGTGLSGTAFSFDDGAIIPQSPDIIKQIDATLIRLNQKLTGSFDRESRSAVVLLRNEVSL